MFNGAYFIWVRYMNLKEEIKKRGITRGYDMVKKENSDILNECKKQFPFYTDIKGFNSSLFITMINEDICDLPICPICGSQIKRADKNKFNKTCSKECSHTYTNEKRKKTNKERYGTEYYSKTDEFTQKVKETSIQRYGVDSYTKTDEYLEKSKQTCLSKYGKEHYVHTDDFKEKARTSHFKRHAHIPYESLEDKEFMKRMYNLHGGQVLADILGINHTTVYSFLSYHNIEINKNVSYAEEELARFVESLGFDTNRNERTVLNGREIDIYIPSKKVAIEFNGLWWHSSKFVEPNYHKEKTDRLTQKGIRLIHVWEDDWRDKKHIVKETLKGILGVSDKERVFARKCSVEYVSTTEAKKFFDAYHIQGYFNSKYKYALKYNGEIVSMMMFKKTRGYMELTRFASSKNVIGGFSKLLHAFLREYPEVESIVSFADKCWSVGGVYLKNGFDLIDTTRPSYQYYYKAKRMKKQHFRHKNLKHILSWYDPNVSERDNTEMNGIYRIYDCGLLKFEISNPHHTK